MTQNHVDLSTASAELNPLDRACLLVGQFFLHFSKIEAELNAGIRKLFELPSDSADIVCANIDFFRKVSIVRSALIDQDANGTKNIEIERAFSGIAELNDRRLIAAHCGFDSDLKGGVTFERVTARTGLNRTAITWSSNDCSRLFEKMSSVLSSVRVLVENIAPYKPSLDFSDPRNSGYLALLDDV